MKHIYIFLLTVTVKYAVICFHNPHDALPVLVMVLFYTPFHYYTPELTLELGLKGVFLSQTFLIDAGPSSGTSIYLENRGLLIHLSKL